MGAAVQLIAGFATNPGAGPVAVTMATGDANTVANFPSDSRAELVQLFSPGATAGIARVRSPRLHDQAQGIRVQRGAAVFHSLLSAFARQPLYPGDTLTIEVGGGAAETDMVGLLIYYENLPGSAARLATIDDVRPRVANLAGVEVDLVSGTVGNWGAGAALNSAFDTLQAGVDYAVLGYVAQTKVGLVAIYGPDTGNYALGGSGSIEPLETRGYFARLSQETGLPCIPIINGNNKGTTLVKAADVAAATASHVSLILAELNP